MQFRVEASIPRAAREVWAVLVDIPKIAGCIPGCEDVLERARLVDYSAVLKQKLGPFKVALPATIAVQEVREPNWIQALASGVERFTGTRIDVTLRMDLRDTEPGQSHMVAECDMQVAGKLASLGYAVIKKKAEENFAEFRARLLKVLEQCPVLQVQEVVAGPVGASASVAGGKPPVNEAPAIGVALDAVPMMEAATADEVVDADVAHRVESVTSLEMHVAVVAPQPAPAPDTEVVVVSAEPRVEASPPLVAANPLPAAIPTADASPATAPAADSITHA